jgi:hypothetical protein
MLQGGGKNSRVFFCIIAIILFLFFPGSFVFALSGVPNMVSFQGRLMDGSGNLLGGTAGTNFCFHFSLYDDEIPGAPDVKFWPSTPPGAMALPVRQGVFNALIGDTSSGSDPLTYVFGESQAVYLNIEVAPSNAGSCVGVTGFENLSPRQRIIASAFAMTSGAIMGSSQSSIGTTTPLLGVSLTVMAPTPTTTSQVIRSRSDQTADLLRLESASGTAMFAIDASGRVVVSTTLTVVSTSRFLSGATFDGALSAESLNSTQVSTTQLLVQGNATTTNISATLATLTSATLGSATSTNLATTYLTVGGQTVCLTNGVNCAATSNPTLQSVVSNGNTTTSSIQFAGGISTADFTVVGSASLATTTATNLSATTATLTSVTSTNGAFTTLTVTNPLNLTNLTWTNATGTNSLLTNVTSTNLNSTNLTGSTAVITSVTTTNLSAAIATLSSATLGSATSTNFFTTNLGATNLVATNATSTNISGTNLVVTNVTGTNGNIANLVAVNATNTNQNSANLGADNVVITNATTTNLNVSNLTIANAVANLTFTNATGTNLSISGATNLGNTTITSATTTNLAATLASLTSVVLGSATSTNFNTQNFTYTNATGTNENLISLTYTNATGTNEKLTNLSLTNGTSTNFNSTNYSGANVSVSNITTTNASVTALAGSTGVLTSVTTTNLAATLASLTSVTLGNATSTNFNTINLTYTNATGTNESLTNLVSLNVTSTNLFISGLTNLNNVVAGNVTTTNLSVSGLANLGLTIIGSGTSTNFNTTNLTYTSATGTNERVTNLVAINATSTNLNVSGLTNLGNTTITNATSTNLNLSGTFSGAGLSSDCSAVDNKVVWNSTTKTFSCAEDLAGNVKIVSSTAGVTLTGTQSVLSSISITPQNVNAEIWIIVNVRSENESLLAARDVTIQVWRGSTCAAPSVQVGVSLLSHLVLGTAIADNGAGSFVDSPATTSAVTYKLCGATNTGSPVVTNRAISVQEINVGADLAEVYYSSQGPIAPGEVIELDPIGEGIVRRTTAAYSPTALGVIATRPGLVLSNSTVGAGTPVTVGLSGRVPVKVSTENGPVAPGDFLVPSSIPGVAMKAIKASNVLGQALTSYSQDGIGSVIIFIKNSYFAGVRSKTIFDKPSTTPIDSSDSFLSKIFKYGFNSSTFSSNQDGSRSIAETAIIPTTINAQDLLLTGGLSVSGTTRLGDMVARSIKADSLQSPEISSLASSTALLFASTTLFLEQLRALGGDFLAQQDMLTALQQYIVSTTVKYSDLNLFGELMVSTSIRQPVIFWGGLQVDSIGSITSGTIFSGDVSFSGHSYFNEDTAGSAVIAKGSRQVTINFERPYVSSPLVNAAIVFAAETPSPSFSAANDSLASAQQVWDHDLRFVIQDKEPTGFTILLNKKAPFNIPFDWMAFAVQNKRVFSTTSSSEIYVEEKPVHLEALPIIPTVVSDPLRFFVSSTESVSSSISISIGTPLETTSSSSSSGFDLVTTSLDSLNASFSQQLLLSSSAFWVSTTVLQQEIASSFSTPTSDMVPSAINANLAGSAITP